MTARPQVFLSRRDKGVPYGNTHLLNGLVIFHANPQRFDGDFLAAISAFPYVGNSTEGDRVITYSGDFTGYDIRGW